MKSIKKFLNLVVLFLVVVLVVLLLTKRNPSSEAHLSSLNKSSTDIDSKVNQYMQEVQRKRTTEELLSMGRLQKNAILSHHASAGIDETDPATVPRERQIWKDDQVAQGDQMDVIYRRIYDEEVAKRTTEQEKKDYALEFTKNARRSGYHIQISMDLEIISVEQIRNPHRDYDSLDVKD